MGTAPATPIFETDRLRARPLGEADANVCLEIYGDPEVTRYVTTGGVTVPNLDVVQMLLREGMLAPGDDPRFGFWALERRADDAVVGTVALIEVAGAPGEHEIGWHLVRSAWGKGYAFESGIALLRYGFDTVGLERMLALVRPGNERSLRACRRIGMAPAEPREHQGEPHECFTADRDTWSAPA